jgi:hypothetical protein
MEEQGPTHTDELAAFLKTVAGGQSAHTAQTYGQALAYLRRYLGESYHMRYLFTWLILNLFRTTPRLELFFQGSCYPRPRWPDGRLQSVRGAALEILEPW